MGLVMSRRDRIGCAVVLVVAAVVVFVHSPYGPMPIGMSAQTRKSLRIQMGLQAVGAVVRRTPPSQLRGFADLCSRVRAERPDITVDPLANNPFPGLLPGPKDGEPYHRLYTYPGPENMSPLDVPILWRADPANERHYRVLFLDGQASMPILEAHLSRALGRVQACLRKDRADSQAGGE